MVTLGIIDTPGLNDTYGPSQDARNMACVKDFFHDHPSIKISDDGKTKTFPNLVMLTLRGDDNRYSGPASPLEKSMRMLLSKELRLTDGSNLVVVLTHANKIEEEGFTEKTEKLRCEIQSVVRRMSHYKSDVPIVFIDNAKGKNKKINDWTQLHDGKTLQPANLFQAIESVMQKNRDVIGSSAMAAFFGRDYKSSKLTTTEAKTTQATLERPKGGIKKAKLSETEHAFLKLLQTLEQESDEEEDTKEEEEEPKNSGATLDMDMPRCNSQDVLSQEDMMDLLPSREETMVKNIISGKGQGPFGRCFNLKSRETLPKNRRIVQPRFLKVEKYSVVKESRSTKSNLRDFGDRMVGTGYNVGVKSSLCEGNYSYKKEDLESQEHDEHIVQVSFARIEYKDFTWSKDKLDGKFLNDIRNLPKEFFPDKKDNLNKFRAFFDNWGHGVTEKAHVGGEIRRVVRKTNAERSLVHSASGLTLAGGAGPVDPELGYDPQSTNKTEHEDLISNFLGGDHQYHLEEYEQEWRESLKENPVIFYRVQEDIRRHDQLWEDMYESERLSHYSDKPSRVKALMSAIQWDCAPGRKEMAEAAQNTSMGILNRLKFWK